MVHLAFELAARKVIGACLRLLLFPLTTDRDRSTSFAQYVLHHPSRAPTRTVAPYADSYGFMLRVSPRRPKSYFCFAFLLQNAYSIAWHRRSRMLNPNASAHRTQRDIRGLELHVVFFQLKCCCARGNAFLLSENVNIRCATSCFTSHTFRPETQIELEAVDEAQCFEHCRTIIESGSD